MFNEYDDLVNDMGKGSRRRGVKIGRPKERTIVRRMTIELTKEADDFIRQYMMNNNKRYAYEVLFDGLELLANKEKPND